VASFVKIHQIEQRKQRSRPDPRNASTGRPLPAESSGRREAPAARPAPPSPPAAIRSPCAAHAGRSSQSRSRRRAEPAGHTVPRRRSRCPGSGLRVLVAILDELDPQKRRTEQHVATAKQRLSADVPPVRPARPAPMVRLLEISTAVLMAPSAISHRRCRPRRPAGKSNDTPRSRRTGRRRNDLGDQEDPTCPT